MCVTIWMAMEPLEDNITDFHSVLLNFLVDWWLNILAYRKPNGQHLWTLSEDIASKHENVTYYWSDAETETIRQSRENKQEWQPISDEPVLLNMQKQL